MQRFSLDALIDALSAYGLPLAIAALTGIALAVWEPRYPMAGGEALALQRYELVEHL